MRYVSLLAVLLSCFLVGCNQTPENEEHKVQRLQNYAKAQLPVGSENVVELQNGWVQFDLKINGATKTFLYHKKDGIEEGYECITEVSPSP